MPLSKYFGRDLIFKETSLFSFYNYLVTVISTIALLVFFDSTQYSVLSELNLNANSQNGLLAFYDQILKLFLLPFFGALIDSTSNNVVYFFCYICFCVSCALFSFASDLAQLIPLRLLFGVGSAGCSCLITSTLGLYVIDRHKGVVSGIVGLMSGLGAVIGALVLARLPASIGLRETYLLCSLLAFLSAFQSLFFIERKLSFNTEEPADSHTSNNSLVPEDQSDIDISAKHNSNSHIDGISDLNNPPQTSSRRRCSPYFVISILRSFLISNYNGLLYAINNPRILVGYFGGFIARSDSIVITLFLSGFINQYYRSHQLCNSSSSSNGSLIDLSDIKKSCPSAYTAYSTFSGVAQTIALLFAPLFGIACERFEKLLVFFVALIFSSVGYLGMGFVSDPVGSKGIVYLLMVISGIGEIGAIVTSLSLSSWNVPFDIRGSVSACYTVFGAVGVLAMTSLGFLSDDRIIKAPFIFVGILSAVVGLGSLLVYFVEKNRSGPYHSIRQQHIESERNNDIS